MRVLLSLVFSLIIGSLFSQETRDINYLQYENYSEKNGMPLEEIKKLSGEKIRFFVKDTIGKNIIYPGTCLPSSSRLYKFLIDKNVVSGYVDIYEKENIPMDEHYVSKDKFIDKLRKSMKMYYVGEVIVDSGHHSYIFYTYNRNASSKTRKEFMVNVKNDNVKSIVVLTNYYYSDFGTKQYTVCLGGVNYLHGIKNLYSDVIDTKSIEDENPIRFSIDSNGFIIED